MKRGIAYSFLFVAVLLVALVLNMPAQYALGLAAKQTGLFSFQSASGTVFSGSANDVRVRAQQQVLELGQLDWQLSPLSLLLAKLKLTVENKSSPQAIVISGNAVLNLQKTIKLADAQIKAPVPLLLKFSPMPLKALGDVELNVQQLTFAENQVSNLQGQLLLQHTKMLAPQKVDLGSFAARLSNEGSALVADVTDIDATFTVSGQSTLEQTQLSFDTNITVTTTPKTPEMVKQSLPFFARKTNDSTFVIQQSGTL